MFTKSVDSNFGVFWLAPVTWNILGYSLFRERREKWCVISRKFQKKKLWPLIKTAYFYPSDLVNIKTAIPFRVGEERCIYTLMLCVSVYIHHYSPSLRGIVVYYYLYCSSNDNAMEKSNYWNIRLTWKWQRYAYTVSSEPPLQHCHGFICIAS